MYRELIPFQQLKKLKSKLKSEWFNYKLSQEKADRYLFNLRFLFFNVLKGMPLLAYHNFKGNFSLSHLCQMFCWMTSQAMLTSLFRCIGLPMKLLFTTSTLKNSSGKTYTRNEKFNSNFSEGLLL